MTIHSTHPFADPEPDPVRRFRGRLGSAVTLFTAGEGPSRAGLTISSMMVANGSEPMVLALVDPDSDLLETARATGRCMVQGLSWGHRSLAEMFAGTAPAPGGAFAHAEFEPTVWGPRLVTATTWAGATVIDERAAGWSVLLGCRVETTGVREEAEPALGHRRGRFLPLP